MDEKEKIALGVAWLRKMVAGEAPTEDLPSVEVLVALVALAERRSLGDEQRDADKPMPETITVKLRNPIRKAAGGGDVRTELVFKTPSWLDIKRIRIVSKSQGEIQAADQTLLILSADDLTQPEVDMLKGLDAQRCHEALGPFLVLEGL
jgi:hypothetical protein